MTGGKLRRDGAIGCHPGKKERTYRGTVKDREGARYCQSLPTESDLFPESILLPNLEIAFAHRTKIGGTPSSSLSLSPARLTLDNNHHQN